MPTVFVMSIARVWGTSLGFPNPGLKPTKHEWDEQQRIVHEAVVNVREGGALGERPGAGHAQAARSGS